MSAIAHQNPLPWGRCGANPVFKALHEGVEGQDAIWSGTNEGRALDMRAQECEEVDASQEAQGHRVNEIVRVLPNPGRHWPQNASVRLGAGSKCAASGVAFGVLQRLWTRWPGAGCAQCGVLLGMRDTGERRLGPRA